MVARRRDLGQAAVQAEGGEGGAGGQRVRLPPGEVVEDGRAAPGGEAQVGRADPVGVRLGVLDVDGAGDGGVEDEAVAVVDAGAFGAVAPHVGVEPGEEAAQRAFPVAGGEDDGVGGEARAGLLLLVLQVEFDLGGGDASGGADVDAGGEGGVGPAAVEGAPVQLVVDGGGGVGVDALVQLPLGGDEAVSDRFGQAVEVAGVVGGEVLQAELEYSMGARAPVRPSQCSRSRPAGRWRSRSRKTSAPDWPVPMTVTCPAARSVSRWRR